MADAAPTAPVEIRRYGYVPAGIVLALVLLRVAAGWHFFREGTKKLTYNPATRELRVAAVSEGFLRAAVGPVGRQVRKNYPDFYNWEEFLAAPRAGYPSTVEELQKRAKWEREYAQRVKDAEKAGKPAPVEFPPYSPYFDWADRIDAGWHAALDRFGQVEAITQAQRKAGAEALEFRRKQLADYLAGEAESIAEWEHELYRLAQMEAAPAAKDVPFEVARITEKRAETKAASGAWIAQVRDIERAYFEDLRELLTPEQAANPTVADAVDTALADSTKRTMHRIDVAIACVIVGVGVCLMLGLFTRLAAAAGMVFLLMVIASQPPWVEGAKTEFFYYQLVEVCALAVLLASAAGRWAGLDYFLRSLCSRCCGRKGTAAT